VHVESKPKTLALGIQAQEMQETETTDFERITTFCHWQKPSRGNILTLLFHVMPSSNRYCF
jgi:hypothetical protein